VTSACSRADSCGSSFCSSAWLLTLRSVTVPREEPYGALVGASTVFT
jgi:hypothetical protein